MNKVISILAKVLLVLMFIMMALDGWYKGRTGLHDDEPVSTLPPASANQALFQFRGPETRRYTGH